jgi:integrase
MKGVRELPSGKLQAFVKVNGKFYSDTFDPGTNLRKLKDWREDKRVEVRTGAKIPHLDPSEPTFSEDVTTYLKLRTSMPTYGTRAAHLRDWAAYFGRRPRSTITAQLIRQRLEQRLKDGYAPGSVNRERTALMSLWTVLDGKSARNPVRDVPKYREPSGESRALSMMMVYRILACMRPSKTRTRLRVLLWTGWPHKQIGQLKPEHLKLKDGRAYVTARKKGGGTRAAWLPLVPGAIRALTLFDRDDCYTPAPKPGKKAQPFSSSSMRHAFLRALAKLNAHRARLKLRPITARPYDLRHSFGTWLALQTHDERVVQTMMLHSTAEQSRRYTEAATTPRVDAAIERLRTQPKMGSHRVSGDVGASKNAAKVAKKASKNGAPGRI